MDNGSSTIEVEDVNIELPGNVTQDLTAAVNPLQLSNRYGIHLFIDCLNILQSNAKLNCERNPNALVVLWTSIQIGFSNETSESETNAVQIFLKVAINSIGSKSTETYFTFQ